MLRPVNGKSFGPTGDHLIRVSKTASWGRAACVAAALWPERCKGLVSVNSYLIQDISHAMIPAKIESSVWYQYHFQTERGRAGLTIDEIDHVSGGGRAFRFMGGVRQSSE